MKKTNVLVLTIITALLFAACAAPPENKPVNTANTNTKPVSAAPTVDALMALDRQANEAWIKGDGKFFEGFLSDKFVSYDMGRRSTKADIAKMITEFKCDVKDWKLDDPQMAMIDADTYAITYKGTFDGSCTMGGKSEKLPSPVRAASVYVRSGDKWLGAWHGETLLIEPKGAAKADGKAAAAEADTSDEIAKEEVAKKPEASKDAARKAEAVKEAPKKADPVKEAAAKKEEPKKDDKPASNSNTAAAAKPVPGPNTDALTKLHQAGWEAWKNKDAAWFTQNTTANLAFVDPTGKWFATKADTIKQWTEGMKCEGVTKVSVTDGFASALSPTVEIFTHKGTANGTCDGQKNGALFGTAIYVKEGNDWKLAFLFESPGK